MSLDPLLSVNELIQRYPAALPVLNTAGIDTCCGGGLTLAAAAQGSGLTFEQLAARLDRSLAAPGPERPASMDCGCGCKAG
jgi:iron-sulfur cluster repair protein YtfE (RIC family)